MLYLVQYFLVIVETISWCKKRQQNKDDGFSSTQTNLILKQMQICLAILQLGKILIYAFLIII